MDGFFDEIANAIDSDPYQFEADYDPQTGYPTLFSVDLSRNIIDEELTVHARDMETLPVF